jgi:pimeloyl-ACP methyl ester carboxylesterase
MRASKLLTTAVAVCLLGAMSAQAQPLPPAAIYTDPPADAASPARMEVVKIPTGGTFINGVVMVASGAGPHPTVILMHGLPGNEKNLDLAQTIRRAGWTVVTFNYRGSWGSPGDFRFANVLDDAAAALAFARDPANAKLQIDPAHIVLAGHSMGGFATLNTAAKTKGLMGVIGISAADMGARYGAPRDGLVKSMAGNMETLAGVTPEQMADEIIAKGSGWTFAKAAQGLATAPLLLTESDDGLGPASQALAVLVRQAGGKADEVHIATDHSYSGKRVALASAILNWLAALPGAPKP